MSRLYKAMQVSVQRANRNARHGSRVFADATAGKRYAERLGERNSIFLKTLKEVANLV